MRIIEKKIAKWMRYNDDGMQMGRFLIPRSFVKDKRIDRLRQTETD